MFHTMVAITLGVYELKNKEGELMKQKVNINRLKKRSDVREESVT